MVDYFVSQMEGIRKEFSHPDFDRFAPTAPPGTASSPRAWS